MYIDVNSLASFAMLTIWYLLTMVFFLDRNLYRRAKWIHVMTLGFLCLWWLIGLAFQSWSVKIYGALLLVASIVVELRVGRRRRRERHSHHQPK